MTGVTNTFKTFYGCSSLVCITEVDTRKALDDYNNKASMFDGCTSLIAPNATEQADLVDSDGAVYVNGNACP